MLCHRLLLGLLTATLAALGLQLTPAACPERQLSLTVCLWIIITPLMTAITIITHPRPPTDKGSQPRGPAPGDSKGATLRSGYKDKAANSGIGDNYGHCLSWRTSNKQTAGTITDPGSSCSSKPSSEQESWWRGSGTPQPFSKDKPLLGVLYCWKVAAPSCVPTIEMFQRP